ncbi:addiction module antidote protein [Rhizobium tumorigenes]|uniref:Addiction module antidote protein n=1 Tax=Rhizobium tumorigenes TaxID=2041385 RepID=A0AAF1KRK8_9HYPH|nr:addiction module antidote protein [Rhizobium tumorigenes]WFR96323.1 putative addiction module antidote protein [Rhizobium tumorigenes]
MTLKTEKWDVSRHLDTDEKIALFLEAIFEEADAATIAAALGEVARAKGMSKVAEDAGLSKEGLDSALSGNGSPEFGTILRVIKAVGFDLRVKPQVTPMPEINVAP